MPHPLLVAFIGGASGAWRIDRVETVRGPGLAPAERLEILEDGSMPATAAAQWILRGVTSNERYVTRAEHVALAARQPALGRPKATQAALIPIRKSSAWWDLPHDERRTIFEDRSMHVRTGLEYLPAIARRLHHGRDIGEAFDFVTWFEFAPEDAGAFGELVARLRDTPEWDFVEREIDIRVSRG